MTHSKTNCAILAAVLSLAVPVSTPAQSGDPNIEAARQHAERGQAALAANNYQAALEEYQAAHRLYPNPLLLINVAAAQSGLGRIEDAITTLQDVRRSDAVDDARKREVDAEISRLQRLLAELDIRSDPTGATVTINGTERGRTPLTVAVQPGPISIRLTRDGYEAAEWRNGGVALRQSEHKTVRIDLVASPSAASGDQHQDDPIDDEPDLRLREPRDSGGISPTWVWVSAVAAGGLAIGGSVFGLMTKSDSDQWVSDGCDDELLAVPETCDPIEESHDRNATISTVLFVGAGVAAAAAIILYTQMGDGTPEDAAQALADFGVVRF